MMATPGGQQWDRPDFSQAVPPTPIRQGDAGPEGVGHNRTTPTTFESGSVPANTGAIESMWTGLVDSDGLDGMSMNQGDVADSWPGEGIRGFRTQPVGGTYNPGQGKGPGNPGTERSSAAY